MSRIKISRSNGRHYVAPDPSLCQLQAEKMTAGFIEFHVAQIASVVSELYCSFLKIDSIKCGSINRAVLALQVIGIRTAF